MISKCSNIVINRTKFSDFEDFDVTTQSSEGLKLVGYIETVDACSGEVIKKNVAVEYPSNKITIERPANYFISNLSKDALNEEYMILEPLTNNRTCHRIQGTFQGDFIQINFNETDPEELMGASFCKDGDKICFNISFARDVEFGRTIKVLFKNFPIYQENLVVNLLDYSKNPNETIGVPVSQTLFEFDEKFKKMELEKPGHEFNFLVTFKEILLSSAAGDGYNARRMVATNIELID